MKNPVTRLFRHKLSSRKQLVQSPACKDPSMVMPVVPTARNHGQGGAWHCCLIIRA